jgi:hypothetical protein
MDEVEQSIFLLIPAFRILNFIVWIYNKVILAVVCSWTKMRLWNFVRQFTAWTGGYRGRFWTI